MDGLLTCLQLPQRTSDNTDTIGEVPLTLAQKQQTSYQTPLWKANNARENLKSHKFCPEHQIKRLLKEEERKTSKMKSKVER
jgi:hypothetical protein